MASQRKEKVVVVESECLLGLRKGDRNHEDVTRALHMHKKGSLHLRILSSAVIEVRAVLYSKGISFPQVEDVISLIDAELNDFGVKSYVPIRLSDIVLSERLREEFPRLTFFDSLHAAISKRLGLSLLSNDPIYNQVGVQAVKFGEL